MLATESLNSEQSIERQLEHKSEIDIIQAALNNITLLQTEVSYKLTEANKHLFLDKCYKTLNKLRSPFPP